VRAGVQRRENARDAVGSYFCGLIESGIAQQIDHQVASLGHPAVFRRDGGLPNPTL
jgi:hypothetical protein